MPQIKGKRVSNYELFFDLAFVLAMGQLNSSFHHIGHMRWWSILNFIITNIVLLSIWGNEVYYFNKYGDARRIDLNTITALMFLIGNFAMTFNFDIETVTVIQISIFNALFATIQSVIAFQYYLKGRILGMNKDIKRSIRDALISAIAVIPLIFDLIPVTPITLTLIYVIPILVPIFDPPVNAANTVNFPHLVERGQLLTILTFGETVIAAISNYPLTTNPFVGLFFFLGMSFMFTHYISQTHLNIEHHQKTSGAGYIYTHMFIVLAVNFFTVSLEFFASEHHHEFAYPLLMAGLVIYYISIGALNYYNKELYRIKGRLIYEWIGVFTIFAVVSFFVRENLLLLSLTLPVLAYTLNMAAFRARRRAREEANVPHPDSRQNFIDEIMSFRNNDDE